MNKKAYILRQIKIGGIVFVSLVLSGFLLMCLAYCLPSDRAALHVRESGAMIDKDNVYKELSPGDVTTKQDNFTDIIMLITAAYNGTENPVHKAVSNYFVLKKDAEIQEACSLCGELSEEEEQKTEYARYWHGYVVILRPLLQFFNLNEIRSLNLFFVMTSLCIITILLYVRGKGKYIIPLLFSYCVINPMAVSVSLQYSTIFYITSFALIVLLAFYERPVFVEKLWLFFMVTGMAVSYFDLLTYPVVALGFPLIISLIMEEKATIKNGLKKLFGYSFMWCLGYAGMWVSKWGLSSLIMRKNYFADAIQSVLFRSGGEIPSGDGSRSLSLIQVFGCQIRNINHNVIVYLTAIFIACCLFGIFKTKMRKQCLPVSIVILMVAVYPFIWYAGTRNHSGIHFFTYRGLSVSVFALSAFLLPLIDFSKLAKGKLGE